MHNALKPQSRFPGRLAHRSVLSIALLGLLGATLQADPRVSLIELHAQRDHTQALRMVEDMLENQPEAARQLGLDYLRGHLLLLLERRHEGLQAFATTMGTTPKLSAHSRFRLAQEQERAGHPEVAAGLVATLLGSDPPRALVAPSLYLLNSTLTQGGDCRLLRTLQAQGLRKSERRQLDLARATCALRTGEGNAARQMLFGLLGESRGDEVARSAAEMLHALGVDRGSTRAQLALGMTFYSHREFDTAIGYLQQALQLMPRTGNLSRGEIFECRYAVARSHFWEGRYAEAGAAFAALAERTSEPEKKAQCLYQQGRCLELAGHWDDAILTFRRTQEVDPSGRWADGALIAFLRLQWLQGRQDPALSALEQLAAQRHYSVFSRAALFLAASEISNGLAEKAGPLLDRLARLGRVPKEELAYWRGRHQELIGTQAEAVASYLQAIRTEPMHPFAQAARQRLKSADLAPYTRRAGLLAAQSARNEDLYSAWLLLGNDHPRGLRAREALIHNLEQDPGTQTYMVLRRQAPGSWPLWQSPLNRPEEMLLALGLFGEADSVVLRHFPVTQPSLAFTGSAALSEAGADHRSLYVAEVLQKRVPSRLPKPLLPKAYRQLLYPMGYSYLIRREASRREIDPYLLAGIIREESRFQPRAFSGAAARGLTQFIFPTARRIATKFEMGPISPNDLDRPEVAIALGAAYIAELGERFGGEPAKMAAAYNAGEPQAELWGRYCFSDDPAELYTKIAFPETRNYVRKVLTSRAHYVDLYRPKPTPAPAD